MSDDVERKIREALDLAPLPAAPFSQGVISALHRRRERRRLLAQYAAIALALVILGIGAPAISVALSRAPISIATATIGLLLLGATTAWSFAIAKRS
jgi:hypothetical protein